LPHFKSSGQTCAINQSPPLPHNPSPSPIQNSRHHQNRNKRTKSAKGDEEARPPRANYTGRRRKNWTEKKK
jgi:hypothetical protein